MAGTYTIYISALDVEIETEAAGFVEKVIPATGFGDDKAVGDAIEDDDKVISSPEWSEKVVSRSEGSDYGDLTFILNIDTHYGWEPFETHFTWAEQQNIVDHMNDIVGTAYPSPMTGSVETPAFVINPGDIIYDNENYPESLSRYLSDYGTDGTDGRLNYPVYLTIGNHDSPPSSTFQAVTDIIEAKEGSRAYRFEYGGVHFICCDLFPQSASTLGDYYQDSHCTIAWLEQQLKLIGTNDRIILFQHYDYEDIDDPAAGLKPGGVWWSYTDADELLEVIDGYNIIAIMHGHNHGTVLPGAVEIYDPFQSYNVISVAKSWFAVIRITDDKLQHAVWRPDVGNWLTSGGRLLDITIPSRVTYGAEKSISSPTYSSDKEIL